MSSGSLASRDENRNVTIQGVSTLDFRTPTNIAVNPDNGAVVIEGTIDANPFSLDVQVDYDGGSNPVYLGLAAPGSATSAAVWQIKKLTFNGDSNLTTIKYANGSSAFNQIWDDRASLSYS